MTWKHKVLIKDVLTDEETTDLVAGLVGMEIARRLRCTIPELCEDGDIIFMLEQLDEVLDQDELNDLLEELYDWADSQRIWLGLHRRENPGPKAPNTLRVCKPLQPSDSVYQMHTGYRSVAELQAAMHKRFGARYTLTNLPDGVRMQEHGAGFWEEVLLTVKPVGAAS